MHEEFFEKLKEIFPKVTKVAIVKDREKALDNATNATIGKNFNQVSCFNHILRDVDFWVKSMAVQVLTAPYISATFVNYYLAKVKTK